MKNSVPVRLYLALNHYPVKNKSGEIIAAAITNLDLHDISRAARTYGIKCFYVVTPLTDQQTLARQIVSHWKEGTGATYNPDRGEALDLIRIKNDLVDVMTDIEEREGNAAYVVATSASAHHHRLGFSDFCRMLKEDDRPGLLVLGTAWGLSDEFIDSADYVLSPISGNTGYNHLSVRSAAAIILDRVLGNDQHPDPE